MEVLRSPYRRCKTPRPGQGALPGQDLKALPPGDSGSRCKEGMSTVLGTSYPI